MNLSMSGSGKVLLPQEAFDGAARGGMTPMRCEVLAIGGLIMESPFPLCFHHLIDGLAFQLQDSMEGSGCEAIVVPCTTLKALTAVVLEISQVRMRAFECVVPATSVVSSPRPGDLQLRFGSSADAASARFHLEQVIRNVIERLHVEEVATSPGLCVLPAFAITSRDEQLLIASYILYSEDGLRFHLYWAELRMLDVLGRKIEFYESHDSERVAKTVVLVRTQRRDHVLFIDGIPNRMLCFRTDREATLWDALVIRRPTEVAGAELQAALVVAEIVNERELVSSSPGPFMVSAANTSYPSLLRSNPQTKPAHAAIVAESDADGNDYVCNVLVIINARAFVHRPLW